MNAPPVDPPSLLERHGERTLLAARMTLSEFLVDQAERTAVEIGFTYRPHTEAPDTYARLERAFAHAVRTGEPLPVSDAHSNPVPYATPEVNYALRFVHDVAHVRRRLSFALTDELELALWHLDELVAVGFDPTTAVCQLLHANLLGSVYVMSRGRRFPSDQLRFASGCLSEGFDRTVLKEVRREQRRGQQ